MCVMEMVFIEEVKRRFSRKNLVTDIGARYVLVAFYLEFRVSTPNSQELFCLFGSSYSPSSRLCRSNCDCLSEIGVLYEWMLGCGGLLQGPGGLPLFPRPVPVPFLDMWHHMLSCDTPICCESGRLPFENSNLMEFAPRNRKFSQQPCEEVCSQSQWNCCLAGGERTMIGRKRLGQATFGKGWVYYCAACGRI